MLSRISGDIIRYDNLIADIFSMFQNRLQAQVCVLNLIVNRYYN